MEETVYIGIILWRLPALTYMSAAWKVTSRAVIAQETLEDASDLQQEQR